MTMKAILISGVVVLGSVFAQAQDARDLNVDTSTGAQMLERGCTSSAIAPGLKAQIQSAIAVSMKKNQTVLNCGAAHAVDANTMDNFIGRSSCIYINETASTIVALEVDRNMIYTVRLSDNNTKVASLKMDHYRRELTNDSNNILKPQMNYRLVPFEGGGIDCAVKASSR